MEAPRFSDPQQVLLAKIAKLLETGGGVTQAAVLSALGYTPANKAGDTFSGSVSVGAGVQLNTNGTATLGNGAFIVDLSGRLSWNSTAIAGLRVNNLTTAQRDATTGPAAGMLVYDTTLGRFSGFEGGAWGSGWVKLGGDTMTGLLQFSGTGHAGVKLNNLTTAQRDAIASPSAGMTIFNTTTATVNVYDGTAWVPLGDANTVLAYAASTDLNFLGTSFRTVTLAGNITFTTSNRAAVRSVTVRIIGDGSTRTFTFPAGWVFVGGAAPANIAANKEAILTITAFGANDADVRAAYAVQP